LRGLQHLLVAAVDELGDFSADKVARVSENLYSVVAILLDRRRDVVLPQEHASLRARRIDQIKAVVAKPLHGVFVSSLFYLGCHFAPDNQISSWLLALSSCQNRIRFS